MTDEETLVRDARTILAGRVGRENAITSHELSVRLGGVDSLDSTPTTRAIVREVMARYNLPIAGCPDGYFVIESSEEYLSAQDRLDARIDGIEERKQILAEAWNSSPIDDPQTSLLEGDSDD